MGKYPPCTQTCTRTHESAWQLRVNMFSRCYASKLGDHALWPLMVTPHCREVILKRPSWQASRTAFFTVRVFDDTVDTGLILAPADFQFIRRKAAS